jgi:CubicO group peptidase (beta-lactamase class C family)
MNAIVCLALVLSTSVESESSWRQYAAPEEAGFSSALLAEARELADRHRSGAVFIVYRGHALVAWGEVERRFECHSVRKSLVNALIGRAVDQGSLELDATLGELGIDDLQPLTADEKQARVRDLLGSRSGVYHPAAKEPADMRAERPARGSHPPGEHFFYNNWDFNLLGTLFERASGRELFTAFREDLAEPLGMEDFRPQDGFVELAPGYSRYPAHAFRLSARDLARFGQLYLRSGS